MKKTNVKEAREIYFRHTAKRGNRPMAVLLTQKAIKEIILVLKHQKRNTDKQREYLKWIIKQLGG